MATSGIEEFDDEEINFFRLSGLLINEGTSIVRKKFDDRVKNLGKKLAHLLKEREQDMGDYRTTRKYDTRNKKPRLLTDEQWRKLYDTPSKYAHTSNDFDLTLLIVLFSILLKEKRSEGTFWSHPPANADTSWQADILRLRYMRNRLYGHVTETRIPNLDYRASFGELADILKRLGLENGRISHWQRSRCPDREAIENLKNELQKMFESDLADFQAFGEILIITVQTAIEKCGVTTETQLSALTCKVDVLLKQDTRTQRDHDELCRSMRGICKEIVHAVGSSTKLVQSIVNHLHDKLYNTDSTWSADLDRLEKTIIASYQRSQQQIVDELSKQTVTLNNLKSAKVTQSNIKLSVFKPLLQNTDKTSFRILIVTPPTYNGSADDCVELGRSLGQCPWDIVIDFDIESQAVGHIFDALTQSLNQHKNHIVKNYKELSDKKSLNVDTIDQIAKGQLTLYLKALGSTEDRYENTDNHFREPVINTVTLLSEVLGKVRGEKTIVLMVVVSNEQTNTCIKKVFKRFEHDCASLKTRSCYIVCNVSDVQHIMPDLNFVERHCKVSKVHFLQVTAKIVSSFFMSEFSDNTDDTFRVAGECVFNKRELTFFSSDIELYHADIGAKAFKDLPANKVAEKEKQIKSEYLHGAPLSHKALHMHNCNNHAVYVRRKEMEEILEKIKYILEQTAARTKKSSVFELLHDPSGGGTTCGRYILYELRNCYPAMAIKKISESLYTSVEKIHTSCNKVCVMLVDMTDVSKCDVVELKNRLTHIGIRYLIVHVKLLDHSPERDNSWDHEVSEGNDCKEPKENQFYLRSIVNERDKEAFKRLYDESKDILQPTVFLFGLLAFCGDAKYVQTIVRHIDKFAKIASEVQHRILRLCCLTARYATADNALPISLMCYLVGLKDGNYQGLQEMLGMTCDFLLITSSDVRLAVVRKGIVDVIWQQLFTPCSDVPSHFQSILEDIKILVQRDHKDKENSFKVISRMLAERTNDSYWSPFIRDLEKYCGQHEVEKMLKDLLTLFMDHKQNQYLRSVYAKYLMYELARPEESLSEMKLALDLKDQVVFRVETEDSELLSLYGNLCREYLVKHIPQIYFSDTDKLLKEAASTTREAIFVYQRAQQWDSFENSSVKSHHPLPFWAEAFARTSYATLVLTHRFQNDLRKFNTYVDSTECTDDLVKHFATDSAYALDKFEYLKRNDRIYDNNPDTTSNKITHATFSILRLRVDGFKGQSDITTKKKFLSQVPLNVPFNVSAVVRACNQNGRLEHWTDLDLPKLELIIKQIDSRIGKCRPLATNYNSLITALIHIRKLGHKNRSFVGYNIEYAMQCADFWLAQFPDDIEGHLMRGVLYIVAGMQTNNVEVVAEGKKSMRKCYELCEKRKAPHNYRQYRYAFGTGVGLAAVVPITDFNKISEMPNLRIFSGHLKGNRVFIHDGLIDVTANIRKEEVTRMLINPNQELLVSCNITFAKAGMQAVNAQRQEV